MRLRNGNAIGCFSFNTALCWPSHWLDNFVNWSGKWNISQKAWPVTQTWWRIHWKRLDRWGESLKWIGWTLCPWQSPIRSVTNTPQTLKPLGRKVATSSAVLSSSIFCTKKKCSFEKTVTSATAMLNSSAALPVFILCFLVGFASVAFWLISHKKWSSVSGKNYPASHFSS